VVPESAIGAYPTVQVQLPIRKAALEGN
jgi:hypothetical protein